MRVMMKVAIPHEPFNTFVREGNAGQKLGRVVEETRPEAIYFTENDGQRGAVAIYVVNSDSEIPKLAEPWFLSFNADCRFGIAMTPDDLKGSGLEDLGKRWK